MPEILDAGTHVFSNADMLDWIKNKRKQHKQEDAEDKALGRKVTPRPANFMNTLRKHERELTSTKYPYTANPGAYEGENRDASLRVFQNRVLEEIDIGMRQESYREKAKGMTAEELEATLGKEHDEMELTEPELLMIHNHAPQNLEMLQPMIENYEERFTTAELEKMVQIIQEVYRCGDKKTVDLPNLEEEQKGEAVEDSAVDGLAEGIREMSPWSSRVEMTSEEVEPAAGQPAPAPAEVELPVREKWAVVAEATGVNVAPLGHPNRLE